MPNVYNGLTEKMKAFCVEYMKNGGNGTEAYLHAYNTESKTTASREASLLLRRKDINEYLHTLNIPNENKAISEREKKRAIIWDRIQYCIDTGNDNAVARYMDILNKMDSEYININRNIDDTHEKLDTLDVDALKSLIETRKD